MMVACPPIRFEDTASRLLFFAMAGIIGLHFAFSIVSTYWRTALWGWRDEKGNKNNTRAGVGVAGGVVSEDLARYPYQQKVSPVSHLDSLPSADLNGSVDESGNMQSAALIVYPGCPFVSQFHEFPQCITRHQRRGLLVFDSDAHSRLQQCGTRASMKVSHFDGGFETAELFCCQILPEPFNELGDVGKERFTQSIGHSRDSSLQGLGVNILSLYHKNINYAI